ncbi:MAG: prepilin-type N-terminal cleavage/methylation domain-containing protein [Candidatus Saccharimonas sp.]
MELREGFSLIELITVMVVVGVLIAMTALTVTQVQPAARDIERKDDLASIGRRLEQAYAAQDVGAPAYPTAARLISDIDSQSGTVLRLSTEATRAPNSTSTSVVGATSNSLTEPKGTGSPLLNEYVYQPLTSSGGLCTGSNTCVRFFLYTLLERNSQPFTIKSIHQQ